MTQADRKILFMALGFLAVILRDTPADRQAQRAMAVAKLIENFCMSAVGEDDNAATPPDADSAAMMQKLFTGLVGEKAENKTLVRDAMRALSLCLDGEEEVPASQTGTIGCA